MDTPRRQKICWGDKAPAVILRGPGCTGEAAKIPSVLLRPCMGSGALPGFVFVEQPSGEAMSHPSAATCPWSQQSLGKANGGEGVQAVVPALLGLQGDAQTGSVLRLSAALAAAKHTSLQLSAVRCFISGWQHNPLSLEGIGFYHKSR